ncbi:MULTISPECIES: hypothetical protein [unclassified Serratia (in: enterobacteria)]|uniref:hypothetical protein n=1 Tax=unclassified Serratia (in: enterobacteria) TaxID=2647522 RepID=UPI0005087E10|nr:MULTISPECIES: hypothetical protein [unclassified Serratia (in: enterobacteria)]KFK93359.1 hypothetical protein JV45_16790 [Serratia sp. Ag2]KFK98360.1 hypothetical protein IV04_13265 [Serratia sp. Ag1]
MSQVVRDILDATNVAVESLKELSVKAKDITVEEAVFNGANIEVTLSYTEDSLPEGTKGSVQLLSLLGERRKWRVFIIDKALKTFKGFKAYHPNRK